jgi:hypothetical protein
MTYGEVEEEGALLKAVVSCVEFDTVMFGVAEIDTITDVDSGESTPAAFTDAMA